jgi:signal peptidase I
MFPTLNNGDIILVKNIHFKRQLQRGKIVIIKSKSKNIEIIKRIAAKPRDKLVIEYFKNENANYLEFKYYFIDSTNTSISSFQNKMSVADKYDLDISTLIRESDTIEIPRDHYYVLGDNLGVSLDSRNYGPIDSRKIVGAVLFKVWKK